MPRYVRKLEKAVWWDVPLGEDERELIADALKNANTTEGRLSIFEFENDEDIAIILAAVSARRNRLCDADYCVFDREVLERSGVSIIKSRGATGCDYVDEKHCDIVKLDTRSIGIFVCRAAYDGYVDSLDKTVIGTAISKMIDEGLVDNAVVSKEIRQVLGK